MLLPMIKTHDGILKNAIKTFLVFFLHDPRFPRCDVIIWTKFYKYANISSTTKGKLTKSVSNFRKFNNPSNELSLKWVMSTCRTQWSVLIANGRFFEENYRRPLGHSSTIEGSCSKQRLYNAAYKNFAIIEKKNRKILRGEKLKIDKQLSKDGIVYGTAEFNCIRA